MTALVVVFGYIVFFLAGWGACALVSGQEITRLRELAEGRRVKWLEAEKRREAR